MRLPADRVLLLLVIIGALIGTVAAVLLAALLGRARRNRNVSRVGWAVANAPYTVETCPQNADADNSITVHIVDVNVETGLLAGDPESYTLSSERLGVLRCSLGTHKRPNISVILSVDVDPANRMMFVLIRQLDLIRITYRYFVVGVSLDGGDEFSVELYSRGLYVSAAPATKVLYIVGSNRSQTSDGGDVPINLAADSPPVLYSVRYDGTDLRVVDTHINYFVTSVDAAASFSPALVVSPDSASLVVNTRMDGYNPSEDGTPGSDQPLSVPQILHDSLIYREGSSQLLQNVAVSAWAYRFLSASLYFTRSSDGPLERLDAAVPDTDSVAVGAWDSRFALLAVDERHGSLFTLGFTNDNHTSASLNILRASEQADSTGAAAYADLPRFTRILDTATQEDGELYVLRTSRV